jgi:hypothetical protein
MNERIRELAEQAKFMAEETINKKISKNAELDAFAEKFAELIIKKTLDEVRERAYYSGDRAWSDAADRQWIELEFGIGPLADAQRNAGIK